MTSVQPDDLVTVRTTFQPSVDLQVSVSEADSLRRRGLLVPDEEAPPSQDSAEDGDEESGQEPPTSPAADSAPDASPPASPPARKR